MPTLFQASLSKNDFDFALFISDDPLHSFHFANAQMLFTKAKELLLLALLIFHFPKASSIPSWRMLELQ